MSEAYLEGMKTSLRRMPQTLLLFVRSLPRRNENEFVRLTNSLIPASEAYLEGMKTRC